MGVHGWEAKEVLFSTLNTVVPELLRGKILEEVTQKAE